MTKPRKSEKRPRRALSPDLAFRLCLLAGCLILAILALPRLGLGYFWDDYIFLTSGRADPFSFLLPGPHTIFYRPISMGLYYLPLIPLGASGAVPGHLLNLCLLGTCVVLLATLVSSIAGRRAGAFAGLAFAGLGALGSLTAWITTSQDVLAILFLLVAFHMRQSGRVVGTAVAAACALLSKETALALMPALVLWPWVLGRGNARLRLHALMVGAIVLLWGLTHPAFHAFQARGIGNASVGYVHLQSPGAWAPPLARYLAALFNLPVTGYATPWPLDLTAFAVAAVILIPVAVWLAGERSRMDSSTPSLRRIAALAALIALPPLLLDVAMVGHWAPYYVCLPGIGAALLLGVLLARVPGPEATGILAIFLVLGVWSRGVEGPELAFTERNMVAASRAVRTLEQRFKELRPAMPRGAELLITVESSGTLGLDQTVQQGQAPRIWYGDPSLTARDPERRMGSGSPLLFRTITPTIASTTVVEINPETLNYHYEGGEVPFPDEVVGSIRAFARGTAAMGDTEHALRVERSILSVVPDTLRPYDQTITALILLGAGRSAEAHAILRATKPYPRDVTLAMVKKLLGEPTGRPAFDSKVFQAFGVSPEDSAALVEGRVAATSPLPSP